MANDATATLSLTEKTEQQREISTHNLPGFKGLMIGWVNAVVRAREQSAMNQNSGQKSD